MDTVHNTCEIVESTEELDYELKIDDKAKRRSVPKSGNKYSIEDDINRLFEAIDVRTSARGLEALRKSAMKRPIRVGSSQASGIGISEPVSLKQALRGLCISQAAETAAMKRLSKPSSSSRSSEAGTIKRLYRAVVAETSGSGLPLNEGKENLVEITLVPENIKSNSSEKMPESLQVPKTEILNQAAHHPLENAMTPKVTMNKLPSLDQVVPLVTESEKDTSKAELQKLNSKDSSSFAVTCGEIQEVETVAPSFEVPVETPAVQKEKKDKLHPGSSLSTSSAGCSVSKCGNNSPRLIKPVFRGKSFIKKKVKQDPTSASISSTQCDRSANNDLGPSTSYLDSHKRDCTVNKNERKENLKGSPASSSTNTSIEVNSSVAETTSSSKVGFSLHCGNRNKAAVTKADERSRSREKGEFSQSSKSSIGDYSSSTSISEDSTLSGSSRGGYRPHMSKDLRWEAIRSVQKQHGCIGLRHFKLLRKLGCGDIGTVYLAELTGANCLFALKVMDNDFLVGRKKMPRAQTEREIMQMLDHPFLPTLFAHFTTEKFSGLVMEYCPGGDLHVLRQRQPNRSFSEQAARFYVAEVLLALEYLHMLGVVYRDLKPENILVREDVPPELPKSYDAVIGPPGMALQKQGSIKCEELQGTDEHVEFEMF
ncbi:hypothetical protein LWI28_004658 [Acer negundo]|uniref:non-specific serine/threonine protein kinase n=1 Tax=Acer negundo TaxID=4023 RepID=A0AAD5JC62_ACENE|nr:hypothetical protein LWI28_004658 [Acer negundo]